MVISYPKGSHSSDSHSWDCNPGIQVSLKSHPNLIKITDFRESETFCSFCAEQLKDLYFCQMSIDIRKNERKDNVDYRMKFISKENRKRRKGKKEKSSNKCPHLVVSQCYDSGEVNFISSKKMKYRYLQLSSYFQREL